MNCLVGATPLVGHVGTAGGRGQHLRGTIGFSPTLPWPAIEQQSNPRLQHLHAACSSILGRGGLPELYRGLQWNLAQVCPQGRGFFGHVVEGPPA